MDTCTPRDVLCVVQYNTERYHSRPFVLWRLCIPENVKVQSNKLYGGHIHGNNLKYRDRKHLPNEDKFCFGIKCNLLLFYILLVAPIHRFVGLFMYVPCHYTDRPVTNKSINVSDSEFET